MRSIFVPGKLSGKLTLTILIYFWIEFLCFLLLKIGAIKFPSAVFNPPRKISKGLHKNLSDPLGWGSETVQTSSNSSLVKSKGCRIHLFGDSFIAADTYEYIFNKDGTKATPEDLLSKLTNCAVFNHGVGGYGSDQSYLKFMKRVNDSTILKGDYVVLSHLTENIIRNANSNRSLAYPNGVTPLLKPKFKIQQGKLKLIPLPKELDSETLYNLSTKTYPKSLRQAEDPIFVPGATLGSPAFVAYPYTLNLSRSIISWSILPIFFNRQKHDPFYRKDSESYQVTISIIKSFHRVCSEIGCHSLSIDLPVSSDFGRYFSTGKNSFLLTKDLKDAGFDHVSIGEIQSNIYPQLSLDPCFLHEGSYDGGDSCNGHYNQKGYKSLFKQLAILLMAR